jgi:asparagine synthase (glutamine-hydrolysing)
MRRFSKKMLARKRLSRSGIFNPDRVKQMLRYETEQANGRYGLRLWMLLTFEVWREIVVEQKRGF